MNKTKLKQLLKRLETLEGSLPLDETKTYLDSLLEKETKNFQKSFQADPTVQYLNDFNSKLEKFKKDFDLEPIVSEIEGIQNQIAQMQESFTGQFDENSKTSELTKSELTNLIQSSKGELEGMTRKEISTLLKKVSALEEELSFQDSNSQMQGQSLKQVIGSYEKKIDDLTSKFKEMGMSHSTMMSGMDSKMEVQKILVSDLTVDVEKFRKEFLSRLSNVGGGSMNQQINVNSSVMSTKYADVNFLAGSNITLSKADDNTNKRVNITIASSGGGGGGGVGSVVGTAGQIDVDQPTGTVTLSLPASVQGVNKLIGGTSTTQDLSLQTTSGVGTTGADMHFLVGNNGATEALTILNSGNVGIGTTGPANKFHVVNDAAFTGGANAQGLFSGTGTNFKYTAIGYDTTNDYGYIQAAHQNVTWIKNLLLQPHGGNVGIGTTGAVDKLHIDGSVAGGNTGVGLLINNIRAQSGDISHLIFGASTVPGTYEKAGIFFKQTNAINGMGELHFATDSNGDSGNVDVTDSKMVILSTGNVGIGTTGPIEKLDVSGGVRVSSAYAQNSANQAILDYSSNNMRFLSFGPDGSTAGGFQFFGIASDGSPANQMVTILNTGNVGIGTTNPGAKLEVGLQGSVAGTIRTAGTTGGYVQIQPASVAGNWTLTLPPDDGSAGQILTTDGNGITTWTAAGAAGITRAVASTAVSSTIGGVASTDYVVLATAGVQLTLPTAISNTNLYTVKNMSASSVLVATTAGQAIDGSATALLPTQYESLSFISNNSVWGVC